MCPARYRAGGSLLHCLSTLTKSMQDACFGNLLCKFPPGAKSARGGLFLLHWPWSRLHRTLSGILPCEARTFLTCRLPPLRPAGRPKETETALAVSPGSRDHLSYLISCLCFSSCFCNKTNNTLNPETAPPDKFPADRIGRNILAVYPLEIFQKF